MQIPIPAGRAGNADDESAAAGAVQKLAMRILCGHIDLHPTLAGGVASILFKSSPVFVSLTSDRTSGLLSTITAHFGLCLRDAFEFEFGSSRGSKDKALTKALQR